MFDGIEIDMLSVGNADCVLVTRWNGFSTERVLVDGGNKGTAKQVRGFLHAIGANYIDHVVCTHPHDDHVGGILELLTDSTLNFGHAYIHRPQFYLEDASVQRALARASGTCEAVRIRESLKMTSELYAAFSRRGMLPIQAFSGSTIGSLSVVGPTEAFYRELIQQFSDSDKIREVQERFDTYSRLTMLDERGNGEVGMLDNPQTSPENESSVILATLQGTQKYLFTADAGTQGLTAAASQWPLANCNWMQIPHHGSRRNMTRRLIEHFAPKYAFVSAEGSNKHPRRSVVNAFKAAGSTVYSTHYPNGVNLRHVNGNVPTRDSYGPAIALYEKPLKLPYDYSPALLQRLGLSLR